MVSEWGSLAQVAQVAHLHIKMDKEYQEIKELYQELMKVVKINNPNMYIIPRNSFNDILKQVQSLERALKESRKSRDNWRKKYDDLKESISKG